MERIVVVRSKDGRFLARYPVAFSGANEVTSVADYFKLAAQNAVDDKLVTETEVSALIFVFER